MPTIKRAPLRSRAQKKKATKAAVNRSATEWWQHEKKKLSGAKACERCHAVWYDGHWHTAPRLYAAMEASRRKAVPGLCEECRYAAHGPAGRPGFEGQFTLDGLSDPAEKARILATIRNFGARANRRDPEDRIIAIDDRGERVVVTTTENQTAVGMAKAIHHAFKGGKLRIAWSEDDLPARVYWKRR